MAAQYLRAAGMSVIEVSRPSRQVRRRHGKSDVIDAVAAARAVLAGEARTVPKSHDGSVEALQTPKLLQPSANKARVVALNQLHNLVVTAPDEVRARLRDLPRQDLLAACAAFRIRAEDDTFAAVNRFSLRELALGWRILTLSLSKLSGAPIAWRPRWRRNCWRPRRRP